MKQTLLLAMIAVALTASPFHGNAQELTGPPADPQLKYSTAMPPGVASSDRVETRLGTLNFSHRTNYQNRYEKPLDKIFRDDD